MLYDHDTGRNLASAYDTTYTPCHELRAAYPSLVGLFMSITFLCSNATCLASHKVGDHLAGKRVKCRQCGEPVRVPASTSDQNASGSTSIGADDVSVIQSQAESMTPGRGPVLPKRIGRFEIVRQLGMGGFGAVYLARDPQLDRDVALKIPRPGTLDSPKIKARFFLEAKAAARLQHPNIVSVFDAGEDQGHHYIASAYIRGKTLSDVIDDKPCDSRTAAEVVRKLADALQYAHSQGIIHRDIKPHNVMIDAKGEPHLMDFGLARLENSAAQLTQDGTIMGTPAYMSPEQASGVSERMTPASDQYSLGIVLYEMLTGQVPFTGPAQIVVFNVLTQPIAPPRTHVPTVSRDLETICLKATAKEATARYASCAELADDLKRWLKGEPINARRISTAERFISWCRREPLTAGLVASVFAAVLIGGSIATVFGLSAQRKAKDLEKAIAQVQTENTRAEEERERADEKSEEATKALVLAKNALAQAESEKARADLKASEATQALMLVQTEKTRADEKTMEATQALTQVDTEKMRADQNAQETLTKAEEAKREKDKAERLLYISKMVLARDAWEAKRAEDASRFLGEGHKEYRGWEFFYLNSHFHKRLRLFSPHPDRIDFIDFDNNGARIALNASVWDTVTGDLIRKFPSNCLSVAFSRDGMKFAIAEFRSEGQEVIYCINIYDIDSGKSIHTLEMDASTIPSRASSLSFCANDTRLFYGGPTRHPDGNNYDVEMWDTATGDRVRTFSLNKYQTSEVAVSPDGTRFACHEGDPKSVTLTGRFVIWSLETGERIGTLGNGDYGCWMSDLNFSPDGTRLMGQLTQNGNPNASDIEVWDVGTRATERTLSAGVAGLRRSSFSPDGNHIIGLCGKDLSDIKLWDIRTGELSTKYAGPRGRTAFGVMSSDGPVLAAVDYTAKGDYGRNAKIWNPAPREESPLQGHKSFVRSVSVSRDGTRAVSAGGGLGKSGDVVVWDLQTGKMSRSFADIPAVVYRAALSPDGTRIACGCSDSVIRILDEAKGEEVMTLKGHTAVVTGLAFNSDGARLVSCAGASGVKMWDMTTGQEVLSPKSGGLLEGSDTGHPYCIAFSPDGTSFITGGGGTGQGLTDKPGEARVWIASTGKQINGMRHGSAVHCVAVSPDGQFFASGDHDGELTIWKSAGSRAVSLKGHANQVTSVTFSPDGSRVVSGSKDKTIKVWDVVTGQETLTLKGHTGPVNSVAFTPDGTRIVSGSDDKTVRIWDSRFWGR